MARLKAAKPLENLLRKISIRGQKENKRSWRNDFSRIKPLLAFFGSKRLADISSFLIEKYKINRSKTITKRGKKRSLTSVNRELQLLSRILSMAVSSRELRVNPCFAVKKYKGEVRRRRYLLPDEEARLMGALIGRRAHLRLIVTIALNTGMRRGETLRLRREDIDFRRGEIHVTKTKTDQDRNIPMTQTLTRELTAHCAGLKSDYLFESRKKGKPISDIKNAFLSACEDAKIEDLWFHDLRHTAATRMGERGVDAFTIAEIMGHSDIRMTRSYTHSTANAKRAAVAALEQASFESGPQMGHKKDQRPVLAAVG